MGIWHRLAIVAATVLATTAAARQADPLFAASEPLHLTIKGPFAQLATGTVTGKPFPGTVSVEGTAAETLPVTLSARGVTRRRKEVCPFPPVRIAFTDPPATSLFAGQADLKLVTHCRPTANYQRFVLLEYAAYRMYNLLTPQSFATRLAMIDYVDPAGHAITSRPGFLLEDIADLARRNGLREHKIKARLAVAALDPHAAARDAIFEDMISNLDWAMIAGPPGKTCCHNTRLMAEKDASDHVIPVPYDFDLSGLVDAPYAMPPASIPVADVRVHRYRGYCRHNAEAADEAAKVVAQGPSILAVLDQVPDLDGSTRKKARTYLAAFLDQIATPDGVAAMLKTCQA